MQGRLQISNTNLQELGSMAYEYGYSLESPKNLCMWEAQFGDFYNPAQLVVDQYIMCSEAKWLRQSGLMLLLPHGFDGAGPEHSTCHMERFLQNINSSAYDSGSPYDNLTAQNINFQVVQPTMPANYFHLLRRQMHRDFRKPVVMAAPKIGLKHPMAVSSIEDFAEDTSFKPILSTKIGGSDAEQPSTVVLCSGKVAFDIEKRHADNSNYKCVQFIRVEELAPFPVDLIREATAGATSDTKFVWVQEEPVNQGAF